MENLIFEQYFTTGTVMRNMLSGIEFDERVSPNSEGVTLKW